MNLKSKKERKIRQVEESGKRGEELKLPELQALSSSTGDEVAWRGIQLKMIYSIYYTVIYNMYTICIYIYIYCICIYMPHVQIVCVPLMAL